MRLLFLSKFMEADLDGSYVCQGVSGRIGGNEGRITREVVEILGYLDLGLSSGNDDMIIYSSPEQNFSMN